MKVNRKLLKKKVLNFCFKTLKCCVIFEQYLADSGQGSVGSIGVLLVRQPPTAKAVHGVGGDGVTELLEGVVPVPALFDLMEQFGKLTCHSIIWGEKEERLGRRVRTKKI